LTGTPSRPAAGSPATARVAARRQRIVGTRRRYNQWVNDQTLEDYALRFTARRARIWSAGWVGNTALGSIAFLACEAIGATVTGSYGFAASAWALGAAALIFVLAGLPVCYYGARYGVDMDLLTRGSGFGYLGSTITSAVYASFTFILFAIEAVILSAALNLCFGLPLALGHIISAMVVIPIAAYGFRRISRWQNWTQPLWLVLQFLPLLFIAGQGEAGWRLWTGFPGRAGELHLHSFAAALAVFLSLLPQIGEQVDYLRFLPERETIGARRWWSALLLTGPGWIAMGAVKIALGSYLAVIALAAGVSASESTNPTALYFLAFSGLAPQPWLAVALTGLFVTICQLKINVTNAYAGSIASSNFFSRLTHRHPGRVVWLVFNTLIALMLMEGGIQTVVERVLALYSNFAVAWFGAVVADLVINKPLGLSPPGIEFRRAILHDINPVGVGAMLGSLVCSTLCFAGLFGPTLQMFSPVVGLAAAFLLSPLIAWATGGAFYIARKAEPLDAHVDADGQCGCTVCENAFEVPDMVLCPVYQGPICSLCCTLEARCHDACKEVAPEASQGMGPRLRAILPVAMSDVFYLRLVRFVSGYAMASVVVSLVLLLTYYQQVGHGIPRRMLGNVLGSAFVGLMAMAAFIVWYIVLARESQQAAEEESNRQTGMLLEEIEAHARTDAKLQRAKDAAEAANMAKSRYIIGLSHEIRTPLNAISGYAQLLERDPARPVGDAIRVIRRSATHLSDLVDGLVDVSRIENGAVRLARERVDLHDLLDQMTDMFRIQAIARGIAFSHERPANLPRFVWTDQKRLRQILINLISNAIKYTPVGSAALVVRWRSPVALFEVIDTGVGIAPQDMERVFDPFERIGTVKGQPGVGLGLTITRLLVDIMGGQLTTESIPGTGSTFRVKMFFSDAPVDDRPVEEALLPPLSGCVNRRLLVVDDDPAHLELMRDILQPTPLALDFASSGEEGVAAFRRQAADIVVMDIAMPGMGGWEAAREIRRLGGDHVAILMVSANVHDLQRARRPDDPHDDYLVKPYEVAQLMQQITTLLEVAAPLGKVIS
jgi:signal transduction histidine kinase/CheY-like chemotaxis protein